MVPMSHSTVSCLSPYNQFVLDGLSIDASSCSDYIHRSPHLLALLLR